MHSKSIKTIQFSNDSSVIEIEKNAFAYSNIEEIVIPNSVDCLHAGWCRGTSKLIKVIIMPKNERYICCDDKMILAKSDLQMTEYDRLVFVNRNVKQIKIPSFVKYIDNYAFSELPIKSIYIPQEITDIGKGAFYNCKLLKNVEIPKKSKLDRIEKLAFVGTLIKNIRIPLIISHLGELWCDETTLVKKFVNITKYKNEEEDYFEYDYSDELIEDYSDTEEESANENNNDNSNNNQEDNNSENEIQDEIMTSLDQIFDDIEEETLKTAEKIIEDENDITNQKHEEDILEGKMTEEITENDDENTNQKYEEDTSEGITENDDEITSLKYEEETLEEENIERITKDTKNKNKKNKKNMVFSC